MVDFFHTCGLGDEVVERLFEARVVTGWPRKKPAPQMRDWLVGFNALQMSCLIRWLGSVVLRRSRGHL